MTPPVPDPRDTRIAQLEAQLAGHTTTNGHGPDQRQQTIDAFAQLTELPPVEQLIQLGRDPETARYTITIRDYPPVRIGPVKILMSRPEFTKVLAVAIQRVPAYCTPNKWVNAVGALVAHVVEVHEAADERFEDVVRDWLGTYTSRVSADPQEAAPRRLPFTKDNELYVNATDLAKYVRQEKTEQVRLHELRIALNDLGFTQTPVVYARGRGDNKTRTSVSYYRAPLNHLDLHE